MKFAEKMRRLLEPVNKTKLAEKIGITSAALAEYAAGSYPRADRAFAMARELDVDLGWLLDDAREEWPPKRPGEKGPSAESTDDVILLEAARRFRRRAVDLAKVVDAMEGIDWPATAVMAWESGVEGAAPAAVQQAWEVSALAEGLLGDLRARPDFSEYAARHHDTLPGSDRPVESLRLDSLARRFERFRHGDAAHALVVQNFATRAVFNSLTGEQRAAVADLAPQKLALARRIVADQTGKGRRLIHGMTVKDARNTLASIQARLDRLPISNRAMNREAQFMGEQGFDAAVRAMGEKAAKTLARMLANAKWLGDELDDMRREIAEFEEAETPLRRTEA